MSSAAARAEARRKAILARGSDRLAKLTTSSGRTEDLMTNPSPGASPMAAKAELYPDPPLADTSTAGHARSRLSSSFIGEETFGMPTPSPSPSPQRPRQRVPSTASRASPSPAPDFSGMGMANDMTMEQQAAMLQAFMRGMTGGGGAGDANPFGPGNNNPLAALMQGAAGANPDAADAGLGALMGMGDTPGAGTMPMPEFTPLPARPPKTRLQRVLPALHVLSVWALVMYYVFVREARMHAEDESVAWRWRWLAPGRDKTALAGMPTSWGVQFMSFFWAFVTLELGLHSLRIFSGFDAFRPPTLLALALPSLPAPIPSIIVHGMKYWQMGSMFLDDVAAVVVALGFIVWLSTWLASA